MNTAANAVRLTENTARVYAFVPATATVTEAAEVVLANTPFAHGEAVDIARKAPEDRTPAERKDLAFYATEIRCTDAAVCATQPGAGLLRMLERAADAQKRAPKLRFAIDGEAFVLVRTMRSTLYAAGVFPVERTSFSPGVYVTARGMVVGYRTPTSERVLHALLAIAADPAKVAGQHGIATGTCSFCGRALSTRESRSVGYGPECAEKWGLPWGDTSAADAADAAAKAAAGLASE